MLMSMYRCFGLLMEGPPMHVGHVHGMCNVNNLNNAGSLAPHIIFHFVYIM